MRKVKNNKLLNKTNVLTSKTIQCCFYKCVFFPVDLGKIPKRH